MSAVTYTEVVVNNQIQPVKCSMYAHYSCYPELHHIVPDSWFKNAGVPVNSPLVSLCPTCHYNTHAAIDGIIKGQDISLVPLRAQAMAVEAMTLAASNDPVLTPTLTL